MTFDSWEPELMEELRLLIRELVRAGGTDPDTIVPAEAPYSRTVRQPTGQAPASEEELPT